MATIYCSTKLSTLLGLPKKSKDFPTAAIDSHGWNAMLFYLNKKKCLLFMNKPTLYCFLALDIVKKDLADFKKFFLQHFTDQLIADQLITERTKVMLEQDYRTIVLKPTDNDKSIIGSMNDCIFRIRYYNSRNEEPQTMNSTFIGHQLNKTPMGAIGYSNPVEKMKEYLSINL